MTEPKKLAAEVKKFTGAQAIDGSYHPNMKAAVEHSRTVKTKSALDALANSFANPGSASPYFNEDLETPTLTASDLPKWLLENRAEILLAFNQDVRTRATGAGRKKAVKAPVTDLAGAGAAAGAQL